MDKIISFLTYEDLKKLNKKTIVAQIVIICFSTLIILCGILEYFMSKDFTWLIISGLGIVFIVLAVFILLGTFKRIKPFKNNSLRSEVEVQEDGLFLKEYVDVTNEERSVAKIYFREIKYFKIKNEFLFLNKTMINYLFKNNEVLVKVLEDKGIKRKA